MHTKGWFISRIEVTEFLSHRSLRFYDHLRVLDLGCVVVTNQFDLAGLVVAFPKLTHLRTLLKPRQRDVLFNTPGVSIDRLDQALLPLKETLQSLEVRHSDIITDWAEPMTPVDFSAFTELATQLVSSTMWFGAYLEDFVWDLEARRRRDLHELLPPNLKTLEIDFAWSNSSMYSLGRRDHAQFLALPASSQVRGFAWIETLLQTSVRPGSISGEQTQL